MYDFFIVHIVQLSRWMSIHAFFNYKSEHGGTIEFTYIRQSVLSGSSLCWFAS
jgi:hypothetical protein